MAGGKTRRKAHAAHRRHHHVKRKHHLARHQAGKAVARVSPKGPPKKPATSNLMVNVGGINIPFNMFVSGAGGVKRTRIGKSKPGKPRRKPNGKHVVPSTKRMHKAPVVHKTKPSAHTVKLKSRKAQRKHHSNVISVRKANALWHKMRMRSRNTHVIRRKTHVLKRHDP